MIAALVYVAFSIVFFNLGPVPAVVEAANTSLLDTRYTWDGDDARHFLAALGEEGRQLYTIVLLIDTFYALTFAIAVALLLAVAFRPNTKLKKPPAMGRVTPGYGRRTGSDRECGTLGAPWALPGGTVGARDDTRLRHGGEKLVLVNLSTALIILGLVIVVIIAALGRRRRVTR